MTSEILKQIESENELAHAKLIKDAQEKIAEIEKAKKDPENRKLVFQLNHELDEIIKNGFEILYSIEDKLEEEQKKLGIYVPLREDIIDKKDIPQVPLKVIKVDNIQTGKCPRCHGDLNSDENKNECSCSQKIVWPA